MSDDKNPEEAPPMGVLPSKSYNRPEWMRSREARPIRILCEYLEVQDRLRRQKVLASLVVFGSARCVTAEVWEEQKKSADEMMKNAKTDEEKAAAEKSLSRLARIKWMTVYMDKIQNLCRKLMAWIETADAREAVSRYLREIPPMSGGVGEEYMKLDLSHCEDMSVSGGVAICTGGGPGLMTAANKGAYEVNKERSMGMGITLPFEQTLNPYISTDLSFRFHYFFTRKFWMVYMMLAVVAAPGGFGTLDELFEVLTLKQTKKLKRDIPVVLFGEKFWKDVINLDKLVEYGTIDSEDREKLLITDSEDDALEFIKDAILTDKLILGDTHVHKSLRR